MRTRNEQTGNESPEYWKQLVALKDEHDPENLFRFNPNIAPSSTVRQRWCVGMNANIAPSREPGRKERNGG